MTLTRILALLWSMVVAHVALLLAAGAEYDGLIGRWLIVLFLALTAGRLARHAITGEWITWK